MNWINLLLSHKGRINRKSFMLGLLPVVLLFGLVFVYLKYLTGMLPLWADIAITAIIALEALHFLSRLAIKRLHDFGRSGHFQWILFSPLLVAAIFLVQQKFFHLQSYEWAVIIYTVMFSLAMIGFFWMLVEMIFRRSDEQANAYGPPPGSFGKKSSAGKE